MGEEYILIDLDSISQFFTDIYTRVYSVLEFIYSHIDDKPDDDGRDERLRELRP